MLLLVFLLRRWPSPIHPLSTTNKQFPPSIVSCKHTNRLIRSSFSLWLRLLPYYHSRSSNVPPSSLCPGSTPDRNLFLYQCLPRNVTIILPSVVYSYVYTCKSPESPCIRLRQNDTKIKKSFYSSFGFSIFVLPNSSLFLVTLLENWPSHSTDSFSRP